MRYVGIDVSAKTLAVVVRREGLSGKCKNFDNTPQGHQQLINYIHHKKHQVQVCLEATGVYHFDLSVALSKENTIDVMVVNPRASKNFSAALMRKDKTDEIDAEVLALYCERMDFRPWECPPKASLQVRSYARKLASLANMRVQTKNQFHSLTSTVETPQTIIKAQEKMIAFIDKQIAQLEEAVLKLIDKQRYLQEPFALLLSVKGIAETSAIQLLGETCILPEDMRAKELVAYTGLNPKHHQSGSSIDKQARISKAGNRHLRKALYMPALSAIQYDPYIRGYYLHLIEDNGKKKMQAICAVMRKLLHAIHAMLRKGESFDNTRFYKKAAPIKASKKAAPVKVLKKAA